MLAIPSVPDLENGSFRVKAMRHGCGGVRPCGSSPKPEQQRSRLYPSGDTLASDTLLLFSLPGDAASASLGKPLRTRVMLLSKRNTAPK